MVCRYVRTAASHQRIDSLVLSKLSSNLQFHICALFRMSQNSLFLNSPRFWYVRCRIGTDRVWSHLRFKFERQKRWMTFTESQTPDYQNSVKLLNVNLVLAGRYLVAGGRDLGYAPYPQVGNWYVGTILATTVNHICSFVLTLLQCLWRN